MGVKVRERPKGSGIWSVFIDHQGKRKANKVGRDRKIAEEVAKKIEARLVLGDFGLMDKDQLGHHSIKVTVDIYGHLAPEGNKQAVDRLDDPSLAATSRNLSATQKAKGVNRFG